MKAHSQLLLLFATLAFFSLTCMAQPVFNYDAAWKKVDNANEQGKPKTAMEEIDRIFSQAKRDKNEAQQVKAIVFKSRSIQQVEEDSWLKNIQTLERETNQASEPVKQILYSVSADLYRAYFQNQRWKIYDRSATGTSDPNQPETWSISDFNYRISLLYERSLSNASLLQSTKLEKYDPIISKGNMRHLRPTLYDLLAHKALDYWKSDESEITKPAYAFELNEPASLAAAKIFIKYNFESRDSASHTLKAIRVFQELIRFHLKDDKADALLDADIARLEFANLKGVMQGKNQLYKEALEQIFNQYSKNEQAMQAVYLLAAWWKQKGDNYNFATGTVEDKMAYTIALEYAEKVIKAFPKSEGGIKAANLSDELKRPTLSVNTEKVNIINKPFRSLLSFKNLSIVYLRLIKLPPGSDENNQQYENEDTYWSKIIGMTPVRTWQQTVPKDKEMREHSAEIKVDALPYGRYLLLVSANASFTTGDNQLASSEFYVSNISFVNSGEHYFVLHRDNGQPLANAKVQVWYSQYDYNKRRNVMQKGENILSNRDGYVRIKGRSVVEKGYGEMRLEISTKGDYLFLNDAQPRTFSGSMQPEKSPKEFEGENARYYFFTDRSIYRPGQTLYFKAIGLTRDATNGKPKLYKPDILEITLRNANYEQVAIQNFSPNEYGSITGNFLLPSTGLTGEFMLQIKQGQRTWQQMVKVEEYKRPKFYVEYAPLKGTYKLNNDINITGFAKGYAGNMVDGAKVVYRVKRATRFMYPWRFSGGYGRSYWPPFGRGTDMEITNGTTLTKPDGSFEISFTALPDLGVDKKLDPGFDFTIEAVVTDINGETRSAETTVSVGYKSLLLSIHTGGGLMRPADSTILLKLQTTNLNGAPEVSDVSLKVFSLKSPGRLLRKRYWEAPDAFVLSKADFEKYFPNDPYSNEDNYRNWEDGKLISSSRLQTPKNASVSFQPGKLVPGYYRIEATTTDNDGQEVKAVEYIAVFDHRKGQLAAPAYLDEYAQNTTIEPGEKAMYWHGTTLPGSYIIQQIQKKTFTGLKDKTEPDQPVFEFLNSKAGYRSFNFEAGEEDRGGYQVNRIMVYHNRVYMQNWMVHVPWSNKELSISLETFREKLLPGENETWKIKVSGIKGEKVAAELLAGMYDASLDQFSTHNWEQVRPWQNNSFYNFWRDGGNFTQGNGKIKYFFEKQDFFEKTYDRLIEISQEYERVLMGIAPGVKIRGNVSVMPEMAMAKESLSEIAPPPQPNNQLDEGAIMENDGGVEKEKGFIDNASIQIRKNFNETAFFFPDLKTDAQGNISFSFTMPEALTQWKLQLLGHTTDARFAYATRNVITQKQLMVMPNPPRFFRQGDQIELSVKVSNLTDKELTGQAQLQLLNAATMQPVDGWFKNVFPNQYFTVGAGQSVSVKFPLEIPYLYNDALVYRIIAKSGDISDGEEMALPVLTNRMLVTESFPINMRGNNAQTFHWKRFTDLSSSAQKSVGFDNFSYTVEYTTNPAWYAIQSLPYLMEYTYDCSEQVWNSFYANALAGKIANSSPRIKAVFESWKNLTPDALLSNLQKNQELKSVLKEETPWVLQAKTEAEQKRNIGILFDMVRMHNEAESALNKLKELQSTNGGFVWFKGGRDDRYITQYILSGIGHLRKLNAWPENQNASLKLIVNAAIPYADARLKEEYDELMKQNLDGKDVNISSFAAQYVYMRSFFNEYPIPENTKKAVAYYKEQARKHWLKHSKYQQGMIALALHRDGDTKTPHDILASLTENSILHDEFGMYWKEFNNPGWYWWQAPIESHALLMEAYSEIENNVKRIDDLRTWLLKQKQTTNWKTSKATAEACYALLLRGTDWLSEERTVSIDLGGYKVSSKTEKAEAGTGYFKHAVPKEKITPEMGTIRVQIESAGNTKIQNQTSWGSVYWQYFEDLDKITSAETSVSIKKELYVIKNTDKGPVLALLSEGEALKVGDRVKVRVEIKNDRQLEYVHLKDMRASCFEPLNVLSSYKFQGGLGYYEATKDASSNFFISYLPRGTWIFEYELRATHSGDFSNGITTLQSMYAPEFSSHSQGVRVKVD